MSTKVQIVNIKHDMPSAEVARARLADALEQARDNRVRIIKLIHGYGSTGVGGKLRGVLRKALSSHRKAGIVARVVHGEDWDSAREEASMLLRDYSLLRCDSDLNRANAGVTIIELNLPRADKPHSQPKVKLLRGKTPPSQRPHSAAMDNTKLTQMLDEDPAAVYDRYTGPTYMAKYSRS